MTLELEGENVVNAQLRVFQVDPRNHWMDVAVDGCWREISKIL